MSSKISMTDSARRIMFKEGLQGFYRGAGVITAGTMLQRGMVVSSYELVYSASELKDEIPHTGGLQQRTVLSGMCAGMVRSILECPFEYIKVRQMTG